MSCHPEDVAYGGMRDTPGIPLRDRVARATLRTAATATDDEPAGRPSRADTPLHCWVTVPPASPTDISPTGISTTGMVPIEAAGRHRVPGVLVEWQHDGSRWWGLVVFVTEEGGRAVVTNRVLPAEFLSPA